MTEKAARFLRGYVKVSVDGDYARFMSICAKTPVNVWGYKKEGDRLFLCVPVLEYKRLVPVKKRTKVKMRVCERHGLPFFIGKILRRRGMAAGSLFGICLYIFLFTSFWGVTVRGNETVSSLRILAAAREYGLFEGSSKLNFNPNAADIGIMRKLSGLSWVSVNTGGCFAEIEVREAVQKPENADDSAPSDIVAEREGRIISVRAQKGRLAVMPGDIVKAGDTLIEGVYEEEVDPWNPQPQEPLKFSGPARGSITAMTVRSITVEAMRLHAENMLCGESEKSLTLHLFRLNIPLGFNSTPDYAYSETVTEESLRLFGRELPVSLVTREYERKKRVIVELSDEELKEKALLMLREAQQEELGQGAKVISEELNYQIDKNGCKLSAVCICEEEIGMKIERLDDTHKDKDEILSDFNTN